MSLVGCKEKIQIVKTELTEIPVPVIIEIDKELTKPCKIYFTDKEHPVKKDIENALRIQRLYCEDASARFKAIEDL